jgi:hypothetical protein
MASIKMPKNKADYFAISASLSLPARCPLLDRCERRAHTIASANNWPLDKAAELAGLKEPIIETIGEGAGHVGGDSSFCASGLCPEVNLFETGYAIGPFSGRPTTKGEYDKYLDPQFKILETGHYSQCAEYSAFVFSSKNQATGYCKYYDLENYLFNEISPQFQRTNQLSTFDFFCIIIWKANRAKSKIAGKLLEQGYSKLDEAVSALIQQVVAAESSKEKMRVLLETWKFYLPMASAILTVLYPHEFTVYDIRVCDVLNGFHGLDNKTHFENRWDGYVKYRTAVIEHTPKELSLRDKDRWLWGQSFAKQLEENIRDGFKKS